MGGESKQTTTQQSQTQPWEAAQPALKGILDQLGTLIPNSGLSQTSQNAIRQLQQNAQAGNPYAPQIGNLATNLLSGGGATSQSGNINQAYQDYLKATQPLASNTNYDPYTTPGFADALKTASADIVNGVNGQFAAAGRDFSGANSQALARGLAQGLAPTIAAQYNQNVQNQQNAASNLYSAGNTTAGLQSGLQQQGIQNQVQGVQTANDALNAQNYGPQQLLQLEQLKQQLPAQTLALLAQIGVPIAGLGQQSNGTSETTSQMSGADQFAKIMGGIGSLGNLGNLSKLPFLSDRRVKEDIAQIGSLFDGTPVYRFRYIGQPGFQIGLMAQDVEKTTPEAIGQLGPYKTVDYKLATDRSLQVA
ncbi:hypothetical protein V1291_005290 [Nitrobacteraceae bacterium AZCC 1564]